MALSLNTCIKGYCADLSAGVHHVFNTNLAAGFSILECQKEFIQRYRRKHHDPHALPMFTSSCPGSADLHPNNFPSSLYGSYCTWWQSSSVFVSFRCSFLRLLKVHGVQIPAVCWIQGESEIATGALQGKDRTCSFHHSLYCRWSARVKDRLSLSLLPHSPSLYHQMLYT